MRAAARDLQAKGAALVLVKGGHLAGTNGRAAVDVACDSDNVEELEGDVVRCRGMAGHVSLRRPPHALAHHNVGTRKRYLQMLKAEQVTGLMFAAGYNVSLEALP